MGNLTDIRDEIAPGLLQTLEQVPFVITYVFAAKDFGAGDFIEILQTPADFRGKVRDITLYDVTETFNAVTTAAFVEVGTTADPNAYVTGASLGLLAATASDSVVLTDGVTLIIPEGAAVEVAGTAPTGGVPAGIATVAVTIQYFK